MYPLIPREFGKTKIADDFKRYPNSPAEGLGGEGIQCRLAPRPGKWFTLLAYSSGSL